MLFPTTSVFKEIFDEALASKNKISLLNLQVSVPTFLYNWIISYNSFSRSPIIESPNLSISEDSPFVAFIFLALHHFLTASEPFLIISSYSFKISSCISTASLYGHGNPVGISCNCLVCSSSFSILAKIIGNIEKII